MNITCGTEGDRLNPTAADESGGVEGGKEEEHEKEKWSPAEEWKDGGAEGWTLINDELSEFRRRLQAAESRSRLQSH